MKELPSAFSFRLARSFGVALVLGALVFSSVATAATTRVEDNDPTVIYGGLWYDASSPAVSGGSAHESNLMGSTASLPFNGTGVTWISYLCSCTAGIANIYIDGEFKAAVDTYAPSPVAQAPVFTISGLAPGFHVITIEITGQYDRRGESAYVMVDAFDVTS